MKQRFSSNTKRTSGSDQQTNTSWDRNAAKNEGISDGLTQGNSATLQQTEKGEHTFKKILDGSQSTRANFIQRFEASKDEDRKPLEIILESQQPEATKSLDEPPPDIAATPLSQQDNAVAEELADFDRQFGGGSRSTRYCAIFSYYFFNLLLLCACAGLIIAGILVRDAQRPWDSTWDTRKYYISEVMFGAAAICGSIPIVEIGIHILMGVFELFYRIPRINNNPKVQMAYLFATGLKRQVSRVIWLGIDYIASYIVARLIQGQPIDNICPPNYGGCFMYVYQYCAIGVQKFFAVLWLWAGFRVISKALTIYMSKHFNNRTHRTRILGTLLDELHLCVLLRRVPNVMVFSLIEVYDNTNIIISPTMNARGTAYVFQHNLEGEYADVTKQGPSNHVRRMGTELFHRIFLHVYPEKEQMLIEQAKMIKENAAIVHASSISHAHSMSHGQSSISGFASSDHIALPTVMVPKITKADFMTYFRENLSGLGVDGEVVWKNILDPNGVGFITLKRCIESLHRITENRKLVISGIIDSNLVIRSLDFAIAMGFNLIVLILATMVVGIQWGSGFSAFTSMILSLTFIFGSSAQGAFNSIVFIFAMTPYNVGDKIQIVSMDTQNMVVEHIYLLTTWCRTWDGNLFIYSNAQMSTQLLQNVTLSSKAWETCYFTVDSFALPPARLQKYREKMEAYILAHPDMYTGGFNITIRNIYDEFKYQVGFCLEHQINIGENVLFHTAMSCCLNMLGEWMIEDGVTWSSTERNFNREMISKRKTQKLE